MVTIVLTVGACLAARTGFSSIPLYLVAGIVPRRDRPATRKPSHGVPMTPSLAKKVVGLIA